MYFEQNVMGIMHKTDSKTTESCWSFVILVVFAFSVS